MRSTVADKARAALRKAALGYPETREDFPWGECVIKVRNKVFVFLGKEGSELGLSVKPPHSGLMALSLPFASPTGYGLAKGGWVTARFGPSRQAAHGHPLALARRELPCRGAQESCCRPVRGRGAGRRQDPACAGAG
jgi:predicted DNA-binding protein (MmcQ/YjbR family)